MEFGRTLRIFLTNGKPTGLRLVEIINWTGLSFAFYRTNINELEKREELKKQGVYFLIGASTTNLYSHKMYIGEAESIIIRLKQQLSKEFWNQ
uniref:hypothetical protein n=1 Tax=Arcobacter sp. TaxID=1872629 RepID=UPI003D0DA9A1